MTQTRIVSLKLHFDELVSVKVHERDLSVRELIAKTGFV
jgi:hypothetical protein